MSLESVRRELWDAGRPTKLAELGRTGSARVTLFDDRVEIGRTTIELVPELQVGVTTSATGGYLTVSGPTASKTIKLRSADEADVRAFAAAVRAAADRVEQVHAERSRRIRELEARLARLVGPLEEAERPADEPVATEGGSGGGSVGGFGGGSAGVAEGVAQGVVLPPEPRAPSDAADPHPIREGPAPPVVPSFPVRAAPGRAPRRRDGRSRRRRTARTSRRPRGPGRLPTVGGLLRFGRSRTAATLLAVVAVAAGAGTLTWYLAHRTTVPDIAGGSTPQGSSGSSGSSGASQAAPHPTTPEGPPAAGDGGSRVGPDAKRTRAVRLQRALRDRFKVVSVSWENDVLVARLRAGDPGAFFELVHASGLDPDRSVLEEYATVDGSGEVVAVYSLSRAQAEALNWREANKIRWNDFLTYRRP